MKSIRSLFMIAIGMMLFTVTANTTAKLEQKQNTELVKEFTVPAYEVSVVNETKVVSVVIDTQINSIEDQTSKTASEPESSYSIIKDVGWRSQKGNTTTNELKEKYPGNLIKEDVHLIHRENPRIN